jgi:putative hydrolase
MGPSAPSSATVADIGGALTRSSCPVPGPTPGPTTECDLAADRNAARGAYHALVAPGPPDTPFGDGPPGEGPFGDGNPFQGLPIFGDLAKLFQQQGPMSWDAARQLGVSIATGGTPEANVDPVERITIEQLARVAELHVANATGLDTSTTGHGLTIVPVTRSQWTQRTLDAYRPLFEELAGSLHQESPPPIETDPSDPLGWMAPLMQMIGPMMLGMTAGSMVGHLARRSLGQYDLPIPRPPSDELLIVPANIDEFGEQWSLPLDDLRLWVCLHDVTHHAVLGIPHVRARLDSLLHRYLAGFQASSVSLEERFGALDVDDPRELSDLESLFGDPEALLGAIRTPEQQELLPQLAALVAVLVGYVDHVMDHSGTGLIGSYAMVTEALRRRRVEADTSDRFVEQLFGLELSRDQYDRGEAFVSGVLDRSGEAGLARLWADERHLPTPAEVDAPGLWLARIDLPEE